LPAGPRLSLATRSRGDFDFDAVVVAATGGGHEALTALFRAYQPMLLRYLRAQAPQLADDIASEVWLAVARHLARFTGDERGFRRWFFTIARCRLIEHRRRQTRQRTDPVDPDHMDRHDPRPDSADPATVVIERLSAQEAVTTIVAGLTPDQAEVTLLRVVGGFEVAEVARIMGRTETSVRVLCHRALRRLEARFPEGVLAE
jgi:RNA polymerase sigma-70 factor (ECF subfamily)